MNIHENSKKIMIFLNVFLSSILLLGQNNDGYAPKKVEKIYGIQPTYHWWDD